MEIWSDIVCPWCYIGKRHFEAALSEFEHRDAVEVVWRAFELDPAAPAVRDGSYAERLARKYGVDVGQAQSMIATMVTNGANAGVDMRFDRVRPGNTFDAHRLLHLAHERGVQDQVKEHLLRAYLTEGEAIGERATLERLAVEAGLGADDVAAVLSTDRYAAEVRADERRAGELEVTGVPFFLVDGRYAVGGAQRPEILLRVLERAWAERALARQRSRTARTATSS